MGRRIEVRLADLHVHDMPPHRLELASAGENLKSALAAEPGDGLTQRHRMLSYYCHRVIIRNHVRQGRPQGVAEPEFPMANAIARSAKGPQNVWVHRIP
jgi:hypothetical protein